VFKHSYWAREGARRLRAHGVDIVRTAVVAGVAFGVASLVHQNPFFAPIAATLVMTAAAGQRLTRAVELTLGVPLGIAVATVLVSAIGTGIAPIALVVGLAMSVAAVLGAGTGLMSQTAVSALLVVTIEARSEGLQPGRIIDALIGATVALVVAQALFPGNPVRSTAAAADRLLELLARALELTSEALRRGEANVARRALDRARSTNPLIGELEKALAGARETVLLTPSQRRAAPRLRRYEEALDQIDYAARNTRVLARHVHAAAVRGPGAPPEMAEAVELLAAAVRALGRELRGAGDGTDTRRLAGEASAAATRLLEGRQDLASNVIVAQVRAIAVDLLRGSGMETGTFDRVLGSLPSPAGTGQAEDRRGGTR
jgi:uncharacterized membrane protein YgaE (UPF0421/DUF939 family)